VTRIAVRDRTPVAVPDASGPDACGPEIAEPEIAEPAVTEPAAAGEGLPFEVMTGHGLSVVAQLASRWAVDPLSDGKVVWAELPIPGRPAAGRPSPQES
jgi:hypothetical protein